MATLALPHTRLLTAFTVLTLAAGCAPNQASGETGKTGKTGDRRQPTPEPRICTEMACSNQATITSTVTGVEPPLGTHTFELEIDDVKHTCTAELAVATEAVEADCSDGVSLRLGPVMRGVEHQMDGVVGYTEEPIPGQFQWALTVPQTPKSAHLVHRYADAVALEQTATFEYTEHRPNGDGCEPVCQTASVTWTMPWVGVSPS